MSESIYEFLTSLGLNVGSSVISNVLNKFTSRINPTVNDLRYELISSLNLYGMEIKADKIIEFLANNGNIVITQTNIFAEDSINMSSSKNTALSFGYNSTSKTKTSEIKSNGNAEMIARGGAGVRQNEDGSISFYT